MVTEDRVLVASDALVVTSARCGRVLRVHSTSLTHRLQSAAMKADDERIGSKALRPEEWAAIANGLLVLAAPLLYMIVTQLTEEPRAVAVAWISGPPPSPVARWMSIVALAVVPMSPLAAIAAWRTLTHAKWLRLGTGQAWRGIVEAAALGAIPGTLLLPVVALRGLPAVGYAGAYVVLGALVGLACGVVLTATARLVLWIASRPVFVADSRRRA